MPDISIIRSPLKNLNNPITYDQGSYYGSKDASLGRFFGNYYDKGLLSYEDQANVRYNNQGSINAFGNFAADLGAKTLAGIPSILGSVGAVAGGTYSALTGDNFTDGFNDNPFLNLSKSISAWGEDMFPHFQEASFNDLGFLDQLKHPGQLGTSNVDSLAFMAQSFGLAGLLSKAQVGARLVNVLAKGKDFSAVFAELAAPNLAKVASTLDAVTLDAFLTTNESAMEAVDSKNSVSDALHNDRLLGKNNMSDKEIEDATAASVNNVFWLNMLTNAGTNLFFTKLVSPLFTPKAVATRANKLGLKVLTSKPGEFVAKEAEKMSGFEKFLFDEGHTAGM